MEIEVLSNTFGKKTHKISLLGSLGKASRLNRLKRDWYRFHSIKVDVKEDIEVKSKKISTRGNKKFWKHFDARWTLKFYVEWKTSVNCVVWNLKLRRSAWRMTREDISIFSRDFYSKLAREILQKVFIACPNTGVIQRPLITAYENCHRQSCIVLAEESRCRNILASSRLFPDPDKLCNFKRVSTGSSSAVNVNAAFTRPNRNVTAGLTRDVLLDFSLRPD